MSRTDDRVVHGVSATRVFDEANAAADLGLLLDRPVDASGVPALSERTAGAVVGTLVGFSDAGAVPLVVYRGQPGSAALRARSIVGLHGGDIGRAALMMFEDGDPARPIIVGCLVDPDAAALPAANEHVEVDSDGERLVISAHERIVLRCGKASITLTKEGKVILQGAYISSQSSGVLRIKGGSVQIN